MTKRVTRTYTHTHTVMEETLSRFHLKRPPELILQRCFTSRRRRDEMKNAAVEVRTRDEAAAAAGAAARGAPDSFVRSLERENGSIPTEMRNDPHL